MSAESGSGGPGVPPRVSVILDEMRWEDKLKVARERRAEVLARKAAEEALAREEEQAPSNGGRITIMPPVAGSAVLSGPALPDEDEATDRRRKRIAALAASVAVAAVLAGFALTRSDRGLEGGLASLLRIPDQAPEVALMSSALSVVPLPVEQPDFASHGLGHDVAPDRSFAHGAIAQPDAPGLQPESVPPLAGGPVLVASLAPSAPVAAQIGVQSDRPVSLIDAGAVPLGAVPTLPAQEAGLRPAKVAQSAAPEVQETVLAFASGLDETSNVPELSRVDDVRAFSPPQPLLEQGEAEAGWSPVAGLGVALPIRLSIFAPSALQADPVSEVVASVEAGTRSESIVSSVDFNVSATHVRYYRGEDLAAAKQVAALAGATVRDFTNYSPSPAEGTVELWLAGSPKRTPTTGRTILASVEPSRTLGRTVAATVATAPTYAQPTTAATTTTTVSQRTNVLSRIFGGSGFYTRPQPAPAATPAAPPRPQASFGSARSQVLGASQGRTAAVSPTQTQTAQPSGNNKFKAKAVGRSKASSASKGNGKGQGKSKPKAGLGG